MVSTHSQYISDHSSLHATDNGRSPLALLAKTCETIGLSNEPQNRKNIKEEKGKESIRPSSTDTKKDESNANSKKKDDSRSPRHVAHSPMVEKTPITSEPSTSTASLPASMMLNNRSCYPFPHIPSSFTFPYPPVMTGFPMQTFPFPSNTPNPFLRCPDPMTCKGGCPASIMTRPCVTPGCTSCTMHNPAASSVDMMMGFPPSIFGYSPLLANFPPTSSSAATQLAYQNLVAAASGQTSKNICNWVDSGIFCGKSFSSVEELTNHMKTHVISNQAASSSINNDVKDTTPRSTAASILNQTSVRYHPYMKTSIPTPQLPNPLSVPPFPSFPQMSAFQAMYAQRLMSSMPHP